MACRFCGSRKQEAFPSEVNLHPPHGLKDLTSPSVLTYPELLVCLDCDFTECVLK